MFEFNVKKVIQAINYILLKTKDGKMNYTKLLKLLYISDKRALKESGQTITGDKYISMNCGPVLSKVYDYIKEKNQPDLWNRLFIKEGYDLKLLIPKNKLGHDELSDFELEILDKIFNEYKNEPYTKMVNVVHLEKEFPEYTDPQSIGKKSVPIKIEDILKSIGWTDDDIKSFKEEERLYQAEKKVLKDCYA